MTLLSRRQAMAGLAALPLSLVHDPEASNSRSPRTFVLVHGAWHGGWCWKKVRRALTEAGHDVYTPTLTGLGERAHLLSPEVGLDTHVQDIVAMLEFEDLNHVVLVGHSYGGMVITGVAQRIASRLSQLLYVDAFLPETGRALADYTRSSAVTANSDAVPSSTTPAPSREWRVPPRSTAEEFGVRERADIEWVRTRLTSQSGKTFGQPLPLSPPVPASLRGAYIQCTSDAWFVEAAARATKRGYSVRTLFGGGHDVMISEPDRLSTLLIELSA